MPSASAAWASVSYPSRVAAIKFASSGSSTPAATARASTQSG